MSRNLLLALNAEHKQRTGHDALEFVPDHFCEVCAYLRAEKEALDALAERMRKLRRRTRE